jgi:hypothetical protein
MSAYDFYLEQQQRRRAVLGGQRPSAPPAPRVTQAEPFLPEDALDGYEDERWPLRPPSSVRRSLPALPARTSGHPVTTTAAAGVPVRQERHVPAVLPSPAHQDAAAYPPAPRHPRRRLHGLVYAGLGMLALLSLWLLLSVVSSWWQDMQNDWRYGRPRTVQTDAVVGHHDSATNPSHFIAINLNQHLVIIEFPGGDPAQAQVYSGPLLVGPGETLAPVTLSFRDVNGDGKPDLIATIDGTEIVFINDHGSFRPPRPGKVKPSALSGQ